MVRTTYLAVNVLLGRIFCAFFVPALPVAVTDFFEILSSSCGFPSGRAESDVADVPPNASDLASEALPASESRVAGIRTDGLADVVVAIREPVSPKRGLIYFIT